MRSASRRSHRTSSERIRQSNHNRNQGKSMSTLRTSLIVLLAAAGPPPPRANSERPRQSNHNRNQENSMTTLRTPLIVLLAAAGLLAAGCDKKPADQAKKEEAKPAAKIIAPLKGDNI